MKFQTYVQIGIISLVIIIIFLFYFNFFREKNLVKEEILSEDNLELNSKDSENFDEVDKNIILSLEYKSSDTLGNRYIIKSKSAESEKENLNFLKLIDVEAVIYLIDKPPIFIYSNYADHDKSTFNTNFYDNVKIQHDDINILSNNLDLMYEKNKVSLYNILQANNKDVELKADKIDFDILTKELRINMYNNNSKIEFLSN